MTGGRNFCCLAALLAVGTMKGSSLDASANALFVTDGVVDCTQSSGGGFGVVNAPLIGCLQTFGQSSFHSAGAASAAYGTLRVLGSINATNLTVPAGNFELEWLLKAQADILDTLTISQGSFFDVTIDFTGSASNAGAMFFLNDVLEPYTLGSPATFRIPFTAGVPFAFDETLRVDLQDRLTTDDPQGRSFSQYVDLSHTVQIIATQVLDAQGNPIDGATISSQSGFDYADPLGATTAAPEPGFVGLLFGGIIMVCAGKYRRRQT